MLHPLLNRSELLSDVGSGRLFIEPFEPVQLRPASYVLTLGRRIRRWKIAPTPIRVWSAAAADAFLHEPVENDEFVIQSGEFILACTVERIGLPANRFAVISPLSHIARFGLGIHCGADFVNPGFGSRHPTALALELFNYNPSPLALVAGMPIAHLRVGCVEAESSQARSVYEGKDPLAAPRFFEEMAQAFIVGISK